MKYNPMSKEFQEKAKELGLTGYQYIRKLVEEEKLPNPTDLFNKEREKVIKNAKCKNRKEYRDKCAQKRGYKDRAECDKVEYFWNKGFHLPEEFNESCSSHFGKLIGEKLLFKRFLEENIFEYVKWLGGEQDKGIDFICKNPKQEFIKKYPHLRLERNTEYKIQLKMRCILNDSMTPRWKFAVLYNNIIDFFILCGCDNREELNILHVWIFHKNDIIRYKKFWRRESISISNSQMLLSEFQDYELTDELVILKKLCEELKEEL